jgi:hypothetical protein
MRCDWGRRRPADWEEEARRDDEPAARVSLLFICLSEEKRTAEIPCQARSNSSRALIAVRPPWGHHIYPWMPIHVVTQPGGSSLCQRLTLK